MLPISGLSLASSHATKLAFADFVTATVGRSVLLAAFALRPISRKIFGHVSP
jgi:hypothetical protein